MTALALDAKISDLNLREVWERARNRRGLMTVLGREGANRVVANFRQLTERGNRFDAPSTGYWESAANSVHSEALDDSRAVISINHVGVRLHYLGGEVRAVAKKRLTIPAIAAAHGKRATEFQGLWLMKKHGVPIALARTIPGDGKKKAFEVVYWLRKSVLHRAEPDTLPAISDLQDALTDRAQRWFARNN